MKEHSCHQTKYRAPQRVKMLLWAEPLTMNLPLRCRFITVRGKH